MPETIAAVVADAGITMTLARAAGNPYNPEWIDARHYRATLRYPGSDALSIPFSVGLGWTTDPATEDVLSALISDAWTVTEAGDFEEWAANLGYDTDSRKAERSYALTVRQSGRFRAWAGPLYDRLMAASED